MRIGNRLTNPGELRTPVTLERPVVTQDSGGFEHRTSYTTISTVLVKWTNAHGAEALQAQAVQARKAATVLLRYRSDVDEACVVKKGDDRYEITSLDNIQERGEYIELKVQLMVQAG